MIDIDLQLQWDGRNKKWRVYDAGGIYWESANLDGLPAAVRGLLRSIGKDMLKMGEEPTKEAT